MSSGIARNCKISWKRIEKSSMPKPIGKCAGTERIFREYGEWYKDTTRRQSEEIMRHKIFLGVFFSYIFITVILTHVLPGKDISLRENRRLEDFPAIRMQEVISGKFQDQWEKALTDRLFGAENRKQVYHIWKQNSLKWSVWLLSGIAGGNRDVEQEFAASYLPRGENIFEISQTGNLVLFVYDPDTLLPVFREKILQLKNEREICQAKEKKPDFFLYYIESNRDIDFKNRKFPHTYLQFLRDAFTEIGTADFFAIHSLTDFSEQFYRTDHHWNHIGQANAYEELVRLLFQGDRQPKPLQAMQVEGIRFVGSRAREIGDFSDGDDFYLNIADLPEYDTYVNGTKAAHGNIEAYRSGKASKEAEISHYAECFGTDKGLLEYDFHAPEKENLLVIADSYSNAINHLLASHFNHSYFVDLRHYENDMGTQFQLCRFAWEHEIDKVLILGSAGMFASEEFRFDGEKNINKEK